MTSLTKTEEMNMNFVAMILGGSRFQLDLINKSLQLGLRTLVVDISDNAPGKKIADEFYRIDTNDKQGLLKIAKEKNVNIILYDQTDRLVPIAAFLNQELGLNGIKPDLALNFTNKLTMLEKLKGTSVKVPEFKEVSSLSEVKDFASLHNYPILLKPKQSQSAIGVVKIDNENLLESSSHIV
jgi:biotin carboxylase